MANHRKARTGLLKDRGTPTVSRKDFNTQTLPETGNKDRTKAHKRPKGWKSKKKAARQARRVAKRRSA